MVAAQATEPSCIKPKTCTVITAHFELPSSHSACMSADVDLRRMRNHRGLKPAQLARMNGYNSIARQLTTQTRNRVPRDAQGRKSGSAETVLTMLIQVRPCEQVVSVNMLQRALRLC